MDLSVTSGLPQRPGVVASTVTDATGSSTELRRRVRVRVLADMAGNGLSSSSLTRVHTTLTRALKWAQARGKVYRNVSDLVETPGGTQWPSVALTVIQVQRALRAARGDRLEALWILGFVLGMRPGQLTGLKWEHVDFSAGVIWIRESLRHRKGTLAQDSTKTRRSRRRLKALKIAIDALSARQARQAAEKAAASGQWTETGYVFTTSTGTPIDPANLRRAFRALIKAELAASLSAHDSAGFNVHDLAWLGEHVVRAGAGRGAGGRGGQVRRAARGRS